MTRKTLIFKWGTSRARDTYGYSICTLYVDGKRVAICNGGGYDMKGTCLGDYIASHFPDDLRKLKVEFYGLTFHDPNFKPGEQIIEGETISEREESGKSLGLERYQAFHSSSSRLPTKRHTIPLIDGACGFLSVERIANAIGLKLLYNRHASSLKANVYTLESPKLRRTT